MASTNSIHSSKGRPRRVHILGGGLAGLSCGADLVRTGHPVTVLEAQPNVGGLAQSFEFQGFTCDLGPHRFHSNSKAIVDHMFDACQGKVHTRDRLSRIFRFGKFIDYPLKAGNVIRSLPFHLLALSMLDYWWMRLRLKFSPLPDDSFKNYVRKRFGNTLYDLFFGTYTEKAWMIPASQISPDWAGQRITLLNLWDVVKKTLFRPKNVPRTLVSLFYYPEHGGAGAISKGYQRIIEQSGSRVLTCAPVKRILTDGQRIKELVYEHDGKEVTEAADFVVSTIPVSRLVEGIEPRCPDEVLQAARDLKHKAIIFVYLILRRAQVTPDHWVYLPEPALLVHRISEFKNFSHNSAPADRTALCAEITCNENDDRWRMSDEQLRDASVKDLTGIGLFKAEEVEGFTVRRVPYAYPLYDLPYRQNLQVLLQYLRRFQNLMSTGRQGLFRYGNMDHSIGMGTRVARTLATGEGPDHGEVGADLKENID